jgi:hypothetical protein
MGHTFPVRVIQRRFIQRTWRRTSEKICLANDIPPGFRIVLLDEDGRVKRDDLLVRSGDFAHYPRSFRIWAFLDEAIKEHIKDADSLDYSAIQLRDHKDKPIDFDLTLRDVREMAGIRGKHTRAWEEEEENTFELEAEIEDALAIFNEDDFRLAGDPGLMGDPNGDLLLKALIQHIVSRFDIDVLEYGFDLYKATMAIKKARSDREKERRPNG